MYHISYPPSPSKDKNYFSYKCSARHDTHFPSSTRPSLHLSHYPIFLSSLAGLASDRALCHSSQLLIGGAPQTRPLIGPWSASVVTVHCRGQFKPSVGHGQPGGADVMRWRAWRWRDTADTPTRCSCRRAGTRCCCRSACWPTCSRPRLSTAALQAPSRGPGWRGRRGGGWSPSGCWRCVR